MIYVRQFSKQICEKFSSSLIFWGEGQAMSSTTVMSRRTLRIRNVQVEILRIRSVNYIDCVYAVYKK